ncbi:MAG: 4-(cytidine 5'-diphospho)-2-C-methyl-D-erythritol kinase [Salibacteraceae bacterium]
MVTFPNIKINIGLFVTAKRPDGYHNIESVMYPVGWHEAIEIGLRELRPEGSVPHWEGSTAGLFLYGDKIDGPPEKNICLRVVEEVKRLYELPPFDIHLLKKLPSGAGLGGGSADAAYLLRLIRDYFQLSISDSEAVQMLGRLGADCPFFWHNRPALAFGKGDQLKPIGLNLSGWWIFIVFPGLKIATAEAYAEAVTRPAPIDLSLIANIDVDAWRDVGISNDFEKWLFPRYPQLAEIKSELYKSGAAYASMSGSGSAVYGLFRDEPPSFAVFENLRTYKELLRLKQ